MPPRREVNMFLAPGGRSAVGHAAKLREDIRVMGLIPIAKTFPQKLRRRRLRRPFEHEVLAVEEIGGVLRIRFKRDKSGKRRERRLGPLPAVADQLVHAPGAYPFRFDPTGAGDQ